MSLSRAGVVAGLDMTTEAALTKLAYLLALPDSSPETVAKNMSISLRGELNEVSQPVFRHPDGALPERIQALTILGYAIAQGDLERVQDIMKVEHHYILNDADYSGNTPVVSISLPISLRPSQFFALTTYVSLAPCGLVPVSAHPSVPAAGRRFCTYPEPQRSHAPVPGSQRQPVRARSAAAQVGSAFAFRRAGGGDAACATEAGDLGLGWDWTEGDQREGDGGRSGGAPSATGDGRIGALK